MRTLRAVSDSSNVAFVTPEATVFEAMLGGWESQQRSRGLRSTTIATRRRLILRLQEFSGRMPWEWKSLFQGQINGSSRFRPCGTITMLLRRSVRI